MVQLFLQAFGELLCLHETFARFIKNFNTDKTYFIAKVFSTLVTIWSPFAAKLA